MAEQRNELIQNRINKAEDYREKGGNPFVHRFEPTHKAAEIRAKSEEMVASGEVVRVAGRALVLRTMGKANFFHLLDGTGQIQVYVKKGMLNDEDFTVFDSAVDGGDILGIEGKVFITKTGELTIGAGKLRLLTKSYRPLPEKWHGLKDVETRYRQRYVDLIANQDVRETFQRRSKIVSALRRELDSRGYMEVETPMMQLIHGGARARPFATHHNALDLDLYLRIAPELYLKRLLVGGFEKVYEIGRNFRNEGIDTQHNPEFTMLELYTAYWDYADSMRFLEEILPAVVSEACGAAEIVRQGHTIAFNPPFGRRTVLDMIRERLCEGDLSSLPLCWGPEGDSAARELLRSGAVSQEARFKIEQKCQTGDEILLELFDEYVKADFGPDQGPLFVMDYPRSLFPLAKAKSDDPHTAELFQLYVGGLEMVKAYSELNDPIEQERCFSDQVQRREKGDDEATPMDDDYVRALEHGMPPASGIGIGIDRLVMLLTDSASIRDVILFPLMRPE